MRNVNEKIKFYIINVGNVTNVFWEHFMKCWGESVERV